ncbi:MAG TPA: hypothetical protein VHA75_01400, partial [Rugosimonospora sp.]|nr:hypothetical protein [Rugosimonospora sp.]
MPSSTGRPSAAPFQNGIRAGAPVNAPWALAIGQRLTERLGVDAQVHAADDGIVIRLPEGAEEPP